MRKLTAKELRELERATALPARAQANAAPLEGTDTIRRATMPVSSEEVPHTNIPGATRPLLRALARDETQRTRPTKKTRPENAAADQINAFSQARLDELVVVGPRSARTDVLADCISMHSTEGANRVRWACSRLSNNLDSPAAAAMRIFQKASVEETNTWPVCSANIFYAHTIQRELTDLLVLDVETLGNRTERNALLKRLSQDPCIPRVVCDLNSEFAQALPRALRCPFPETREEARLLLFEVFYGPPPIAALIPHFEAALDRLPPQFYPLDFVTQLATMQPGLFTRAMEFLEGCENLYNLPWKLLDLLGNSPLAQRRFTIDLDHFPFGDFPDLPIASQPDKTH